ncbi:MAG: cell division protein MukB [Lachnospiraceae bacterium]|nr:cell division protein MukB [Lachnospiraceae bacterium]
MKKLRKIRLINWHRFSNETIELDDSVLLSGENGAGKSTLLDAIQFVITCSKAHFNVAAHDKGKRNLNSYMRCKTGREDRPFERTGEITSHIALEFYDESRKQPFIVGTVLDSASEEKEPNAVWYLMENQTIEDELFLQGNKVKSIAVFRATNKKIRTFATTQTEAKKMMLSRFGRLEDKFFSLIPKALAFKPIHDIKDFVYSYVLDEKEVNIDSLKENVRSYQDLERMLQDVKTRIGELEKINEKEADIEKYQRIDRNQEYYLARVDVDLLKEAKIDAEDRKRNASLQEEELKRRRRDLLRQQEECQSTITNLSVELDSNEDYRALHELERRRDELTETLKQDKEEVHRLKAAAKEAFVSAQSLLQVKDVDSCVKEYAAYLKDLEKCEQLTAVWACLEKVISYKKEMYGKIQEKLAEKRLLLRTKQEEMTELSEKIRLLEKKQLTYPKEVTLLSGRIREQFKKAGRSGEVRILCELLEVTDPAWQNAVEGYLNNQRFYLLVEPEDFDLALSVYDRARENKKAYGVGLINTGRLEEFDEAPEGSLAQKVTSKSIWARRYINMILGRVHCCKSYQELKQYPTAITRQCMRYQNHVVSAIRPEVFQTPYIGKEAYLRQLKQCREQEKSLKQETDSIREQINNLNFVAKPLDSTADIDVKYRLSSLEQKRNHENQLSQCTDQIRKLQENQTLIQKTIHLDELKKQHQTLQDKISGTDNRIGQCQQEQTQLEGRIMELDADLSGKQAFLAQLIERLGPDASSCEKEYLARLAESESLPRFRENFERARKANATLRDNAEKDMVQLMRAYKIAHDFGAAESLQGYPEFLAEYDKLKNSQLLDYEEKVMKARQAAEEEFREQFLSRLQENIKQAQSEFKELNRSLKDIHFSKEQYEFLQEPNRKLKKYYQMIMDDFNVLQGESLFSGLFRENHREVIEELFEKLIADDDNSTKVLEEYTDYRTYMDYDIKIQNEDGSYMLYSKVSREKSGGETQTPFYITVAASFMQLYRNSIGGDAIGLVMFDEAFNNMDDERIGAMLEFLTHANLQLIIAAPPDKIQYIGPSVKQVLLVLQDGEESYVEEFGRV